MNVATPSPSAEAASQRLAQTRQALLRHMAQDRSAGRVREAPAEPRGPAPHEAATEGFDPLDHEGPGLWQDLRQAAGAWWQAQPARLALEVAEPLFVRYTQAHPVRVLAVAAAAGAAFVLLRPWRLISITGLLVAALKSTQLSALAAAVLRPRAPAAPPDEPH